MASTTRCVPGGPYTASGTGSVAITQLRRDDVVQVGDVVAVQVGQQHRRQTDRQHPGAGQPHHHTAAAVDEQGRVAGAHERGRPGAVGIGQRAAGPEQRDLDAQVFTCQSMTGGLTDAQSGWPFWSFRPSLPSTVRPSASVVSM